jgi:hypothetical protein
MILNLNPSNIGIVITVLGTIVTFFVQHSRYQLKIDSLEEKVSISEKRLNEKVSTLERNLDEKISISEKKIEKSETHNIDMATRNSVLETKMIMIETTINEIRSDIKLILRNQG